MTYPAAAKSVQIRTADPAVGDLDVDIGLLPFLGLKLLPDHLAFGRLLVEAHPPFKLVVLSHCERDGGGKSCLCSGLCVVKWCWGSPIGDRRRPPSYRQAGGGEIHGSPVGWIGIWYLEAHICRKRKAKKGEERDRAMIIRVAFISNSALNGEVIRFYVLRIAICEGVTGSVGAATESCLDPFGPTASLFLWFLSLSAAMIGTTAPGFCRYRVTDR